MTRKLMWIITLKRNQPPYVPHDRAVDETQCVIAGRRDEKREEGQAVPVVRLQAQLEVCDDHARCHYDRAVVIDTVHLEM